MVIVLAATSTMERWSLLSMTRMSPCAYCVSSRVSAFLPPPVVVRWRMVRSPAWATAARRRAGATSAEEDRMIAAYARRSARSRGCRAIDQVGSELGMTREPGRGAAHRLLVLLVDEAIDRPLEPAQHRGPHVEALAEAQPRVVRPLRLEHDGTGETRAEHDVVVALARSHVLHQLVRLAAPPEGERIDHLAQQPVAVRI